MTRVSFKLSLAFAALLLPLQARAMLLDLPTAVGRALQNNPAVSQAREKITEVGTSKNILRASLFPSVELSAYDQYRKDAVANKAVSAVPFGGEPYNQYQVDLKATQPLFAWGSLSAIRRADLDRQVSEKDLEISERALVARVIQAYYKVVLSENLLRLLMDEQKVVTESLSTAQSRQRTGRGQLIDVLQVKTQAALLRTKVEDARNQFDSSASDLANAMGDTQKLDLELKGHLPSLYVKDVDSKLNMRVFKLPELDRLLLTHDQLEEQKSITLGKNLPNVKVVGDYNFTNYTKSDLFDSASKAWSVELLLTVPLFSGLSSIYERKAIISQEEQLELQKRDVGNNLILAQIKSRKAVESAEASLASAEEAANLADQSLAEARRTYRLATIDFLQFLQVEQSDIEAISSLNQLKFNAIVAYTNYFVASGQPLNVLVDLLAKEGGKK